MDLLMNILLVGKAKKNDANLGLTRTEVIDTERKLLNSITLGTPIQFLMILS